MSQVPTIPMTPEQGSSELAWISRVQLLLIPVGGLLWLLKSWRASLVFVIGCAASLGFWHVHGWLVARMLAPSGRWFYGSLSFLKLALIGAVLYEMIKLFPGEHIPLTTGILSFVLAIVLLAVRQFSDPS